MSSRMLCSVLILILAAELQLTVCQEGQQNNTSLVSAYSATVLDGGEQICPSQEQLQMAKAEIVQDVRDILSTRGLITTLCPGQTQESPAASCLDVSQCNRQLPSEYYWIISSNGTAVQMYCDMDRQCNCTTGSIGGWSRVAYLNMTDPTQQCPPAWTEITEPVRTCGRSAANGCFSSVYSSYGITYSHICGRIRGFQHGGTRAFFGYNTQGHLTIEEPFVDGVVITRGSVRQHVWTFAAALSEDPFYSQNIQCPCTDVQNAGTGSTTIPPFVGDDYFCETAATTRTVLDELYADDPLWDGENCGSGSTCCEFNNPPYFCKSLLEATADDIEVRICANADPGQGNAEEEDTPIQLIEIYIQ